MILSVDKNFTREMMLFLRQDDWPTEMISKISNVQKVVRVSDHVRVNYMADNNL